MQKRKKKNICILVCVLIATCGFLLPSFTNALSEIQQKTVLSGAEEQLSELDGDEMDRQMAMCRQYNQDIYSEQQITPFAYHEGTAGDTEYDKLLPYSAMCILDVPSLGITLPVAHSTDADKLQYEAGHMHGTSLPTGGESTHAVIAAHTGLTTAKLFDRLTEIKKGDYFYITVLSEKHSYRVDRILTILPEEEGQYLQVTKGKDYVTLYTCTPYGVNDHRLLVRGIRDPSKEIDDYAENQGEIAINNVSRSSVISLCVCIAIPAVILITGICLIWKDEKKCLLFVNKAERK